VNDQRLEQARCDMARRVADRGIERSNRKCNRWMLGYFVAAVLVFWAYFKW
jgi:hypothetical protein